MHGMETMRNGDELHRKDAVLQRIDAAKYSEALTGQSTA
jgi:hypothetical protein